MADKPGTAETHKTLTEKSTNNQELAYADLQQTAGEIQRNNNLLRNRVRMLEQEHKKAQRKIQETAKKTHELVSLRQQNDEKYLKVKHL